MTRELERAMADACLGAQAGEAVARDLRGFLERRGVAPEDVDAALASPPRLAVYRSLVRNGLTGVVVRMLPRTRARMNDACGGRFDADVERFLDQVGPRTHYLRDVPAELLAWADPQWRADPSLPPYLPDLAAHELTAFAVAASSDPRRGRAAGDVAVDRPLAFDESVRMQRYGWAVHELPAEPTAREPPPRRDVELLAYRDAEHHVRWLELTPLAASLARRLVAGEALGAAVAGACADHRTSPAAVGTDVARLLADLGERGVLLGARD